MDRAADWGRAVLDGMVAGENAKVVEWFDATMSQLMDADAVGAAWQQVLLQAGALLSIGEPTATVEEGYHVVAFPVDFERGKLACRLIFDQSQKLAGFHFNPAG